jgi:putative pyruvate formate lyase activating enzyme
MGSGTIFFSGCNLGCVFCQNFEISQSGGGQECEPAQLVELMLGLQKARCHNINFVTPEHVVPQILEALPLAIERGLRLPLVYNTGAYDSLESIQLMDGVVDIYMPDFKLWDAQRCAKYLRAEDYPAAARVAIREMHRQVGELRVDEDGLALRGVLVRHLVMPGLLEDTRAILHWLATELSPDTYVNVMDQYRPAFKAEADPRFAEISRCSTCSEHEQAMEAARRAGLWRLDTRWRTWG